MNIIKEEMDLYKVEEGLIKIRKMKWAASSLIPYISELVRYISSQCDEIDSENYFIYYNTLIVAKGIASRANTHRLKNCDALEELRVLCEEVKNSEKYQQLSIK